MSDRAKFNAPAAGYLGAGLVATGFEAWNHNIPELVEVVGVPFAVTTVLESVAGANENDALTQGAAGVIGTLGSAAFVGAIEFTQAANSEGGVGAYAGATIKTLAAGAVAMATHKAETDPRYAAPRG